LSRKTGVLGGRKGNLLGVDAKNLYGAADAAIAPAPLNAQRYIGRAASGVEILPRGEMVSKPSAQNQGSMKHYIIC
jgi:hypothetical protein